MALGGPRHQLDAASGQVRQGFWHNLDWFDAAPGELSDTDAEVCRGRDPTKCPGGRNHTECDYGYEGPMCGICDKGSAVFDPIFFESAEGRCEPACVQGDCGGDFSCMCDAGWTGVACDKPLPCGAPEAPVPATSPRRLAALAASLPRREARISIAPKPCGDHGVCRDGLCFCDTPWFGLQCERQQCSDDNCGGHGQ